MRTGAKELPSLGAQCADTHTHLDMLDDPAGALERCTLAGVMYVATIADVTESGRGTYDLLPKWHGDAQARLDEWAVPHGMPPQVRVVVGAHPHNAKCYDQAAAEEIAMLAADPRTVALGEMGLDFHYDHSPREIQEEAFRKQLQFAHDVELPVVVHLREATEEGIAILSEIGVPEAGCVIHCFSGGAEEALRFVDMGCHISFAGPVTFKKSDALRAAAKEVPLDRLLTETDAPFLAPEPYRGKTNEPSWVTLTVEAIAQVRDEDTATVASATIENARALFRDVRPEGG